jgi:Predicted pyridoxal phosphate-dependent enzyme apparently involved in regulation of cell wall biogenesis
MALIRFYKPTLRRKDMDAVLQTMVDEKIGPGEKKKEFVTLFSQLIPDVKGGLALRTYPDAIKLALLSVGCKAGDKVALSVLSPMIYKSVVEMLGMKLMLLDIDSETGCLSLKEAERAANEGAKAFLVHEPLGQIPYNLTEIDNFNLPVIEDVTESLGCRLGDFKPGMLGQIVISALEEDGIISTGGGAVLYARKSEVWDKVRAEEKPLRFYTELSDMNAALGIIQLLYFEQNLKRRFELYTQYKNSVQRTGNHLFGIENIDYESNGFMFSVILNSKPDAAIAFANKYSVSCAPSFSTSIGSLYADKFELFPEALPSINRAVSFPLYPFLQQKEQESIVKVLSHLP